MWAACAVARAQGSLALARHAAAWRPLPRTSQLYIDGVNRRGTARTLFFLEFDFVDDAGQPVSCVWEPFLFAMVPFSAFAKLRRRQPDLTGAQPWRAAWSPRCARGRRSGCRLRATRAQTL